MADRARLSGAQTGTGPCDYEGRGWRGFHHHATLCIAAYGFLIAERGALPPSGPPCTPLFSGSALPDDYRPRGAADPRMGAKFAIGLQPPSPGKRGRGVELNQLNDSVH